MMGTRNMFAWSFDRLAPEKLTTVSDRFHTPVIATITIGVIVELLNYLNIYQGLGNYLLNIIAVHWRGVHHHVHRGRWSLRGGGRSCTRRAPGWARRR